MSKVETTLTLEQLDAALKLDGKLRAFYTGYAKGFAAGLEAGAEMAEEESRIYRQMGEMTEEIIMRDFATAIRERAREEKAGKTIEREGK